MTDQRFEIITPAGQRYEGVNPEAWARQLIAQPDQVTDEVRAVLTCLLATIDGLRARVWEQDAVEGKYLAEQSLTNPAPVVGAACQARDWRGPGEDDAEVWIPPQDDCMNHAHEPCPHCTSRVFHHRTGRCGTCGRRPVAEP